MSKENPTRQEIYHTVQSLMVNFDRARWAAVPKEFIVEVEHEIEPGQDVTLLYRKTVLEIACDGTSWDGVVAKFETMRQLKAKEFTEVRVMPYQDYILLVGITLIGKKEDPP